MIEESLLVEMYKRFYFDLDSETLEEKITFLI